MSHTLADKLRLQLSRTKRRMVIADGSTGDSAGKLLDIPISLGDIVIRLDFKVIK